MAEPTFECVIDRLLFGALAQVSLNKVVKLPSALTSVFLNQDILVGLQIVYFRLIACFESLS